MILPHISPDSIHKMRSILPLQKLQQFSIMDVLESNSEEEEITKRKQN
jgi:hypothetical protein